MTMPNLKPQFDSIHQLLAIEVGLQNDAINSYTKLVEDALDVGKYVAIDDLKWEEKMVIQSFGRVKELIKQLEEIKDAIDPKRSKDAKGRGTGPPPTWQNRKAGKRPVYK
ncbi:hypothetical protein K440DRAFT_668501 [Wilcoxina mikolae CBS 423.85]|nr:hypothetical protein K440DRAFT_668501 [Wilcoxina mikolae CBS 423.85]